METLEQLISRANALAEKHENYRASSGKVFAELKDRIKNSNDGAPWGHNWRKFASDPNSGLKVTYSHAQRLISYHQRPDIGAERKEQKNAYARKARATQRNLVHGDQIDHLAALKHAWYVASPNVREEFLAWAQEPGRLLEAA